MHFTAFATILAAVATMAAGSPLELVSKSTLDVFDPTIISPNARTVWVAGHVETVVWDTSNAPADISNAGEVSLKGVPGFIAGPFDLRLGKINVTVPQVPAGKYTITLFGDSGNISPEFYIIA